MAITKTLPAWPTWGAVAALVAILFGEKPLADASTARLLLSGGGAAFLLAAAAVRISGWLGAQGPRRDIARTLALGSVGVAAAMAIYFFGTDALFAEAAHAGHAEHADEGPSRLPAMLAVLWPLLLTISLVPTLAAQWAIGSSAASAGVSDSAAAESHRVTELAASGLSVALAAGFLFVGIYISHERDAKHDVSYFKTSSPGESVVNMVNSFDKPLEVLLFFPPVNEVKDEVSSYFQELSARSGALKVRDADRMAEVELAKEYRVTRDGIIVLKKGDQHRNITLDVELPKARRKLREFDSEVQKALYKVARDAKTVYTIGGHGEMNSPDPSGPKPTALTQTKVLTRLLQALNYRVRELSVRNGLAQDVPDDATLVVLLAPTTPLLEEELDALDRYLARGGAMLIAMEPGREIPLGPLEQRLGVRFDSTPLTNDKQFVPANRTFRTKADMRNLAVTQFSSHASVTSLSRAQGSVYLVMLSAGSLEETEFSTEYGDRKPRRSYPIRSMPTTFADVDNNFAFNEETEKRKAFNLMATIEATVDGGATGPDAAEPKVMRVAMLADATALSDMLLSQPSHQALAQDIFKWLSEEEKFSGEVTSEVDVPIKHSEQGDAFLFYATIVLAPLILFGFGLFTIRLRRRKETAS